MIRLLTTLLLVLAAPAAHAQVETPDEPTVFADFGFGGVTPAGCWTPITVAVQAVEDPLSGSVELSYIAGGERISHIAPFAVAAQSNALIPMTVHLPWWTDTVTVSAFDERRGRVAQLDYRSTPGPTDARLPNLLTPRGIVLSATTRLPASTAVDALQPDPEDTSRKPRDLNAVNVAPDRLPPNRLAYDSIELLVLEPADLPGIDPRAIEAILRWTASGGRLLLLADQPGSDHARWLAATPASAAVTVGTIEPDETLGTLRPLTINPVAAAAGWHATSADSTGRTFAASGQLGFGWLGIISVDPLTSDPARQALRTLLETSALEGATDDLASTIIGDRASWLDPAMGRSADELLYRHIDAVSTSEPPGAGGFILIAAVPLALALLLGPIDYLALGALRRRPIAWLSALVWIAVVGTVAFTAPQLFQTGKADIGSVAATDLVLPNLALPRTDERNAAARIPPHLAGWSTEATLLFHASQEPFTLEAASPSAWRPFESGRSAAATLAGMTFRQTPTGPGPDAPAGIEPLRIPARIWSLVTLHAEGPAAPAFAVALNTDNADDPTQYTLDITGLPDDAAVRVGRVVHQGKLFQLTDADAETLRFAARGAAGFDVAGPFTEQVQAGFAVLAGEPSRRNAGVAALQDAGWARIDLLVETPPATFAFTTSEDTTRTRFTHYRILTPMPEASEPTP